MFVKWAIVKLLITMHLAMPAEIFTKAVDLETPHEDAQPDDEHPVGLPHSIGESASLRKERPRGATLVIKYGTSARDRTRRCGT